MMILLFVVVIIMVVVILLYYINYYIINNHHHFSSRGGDDYYCYIAITALCYILYYDDDWPHLTTAAESRQKSVQPKNHSPVSLIIIKKKYCNIVRKVVSREQMHLLLRLLYFIITVVCWSYRQYEIECIYYETNEPLLCFFLRVVVGLAARDDSNAGGRMHIIILIWRK